MQYLQKSMGYEIDFLPAGKHKNVPQIDIIILRVHSQACPKHPKQLVHNIFAIPQGKCKGWSWFLPADNCQRFPQSDIYYHFRCTWPGMPKLPKIRSLLFFCNILRKKWMMKLIFCMQITMKTYCKLILWFWWGDQAFQKFPK